jgi:hypothetical protein
MRCRLWKTLRFFSAVAALGAVLTLPAWCAAPDFVVEPYIQLGERSSFGGPARLAVLWHAEDVDVAWSVEFQAEGAPDWRRAAAPGYRRVAAPTIAPHRVYRATLEGLPPGAEVAYRVLRGEKPVFQATTKAPAGPGGHSRVAVFGDCGAGTPEQRAIAHGVSTAQPDYAVVTGDIVYSRGRISEYRPKFYPVYNAATASPEVGAPLLRSTLFVAAPGNHDIATRDLGTYPDGLAYFLYWDQPRNGFDNSTGAAAIGPLSGPQEHQTLFRQAAGDAYPRMANFSFDYGDAHWTILDGNGYVDWSAPELREWLARDLAAAQDRPWRFVAFHQPGFNSSKAHFDDQRTRLIAPLLEEGKVTIAFAGHVHNYQRSHPLYFRPDGAADASSRVSGTWKLDTTYNGRDRTRPDGVIYIVTGAGGARLYNPEQQDDPVTWQAFTDKFISKIHTFTVMDVEAGRLTVRQLSASGEEVDRFEVTR